MCLFIALFFCTACFQKKTEFKFPLDQTLRVSIGAEPPTLDWNKAIDVTSSLIIDNIMEGLTEYDFSTGKPVVIPALAKAWLVSKDQKHWTFILRKTVRWNDGELLTAEHFKDSWERLLNPKTASEYAYFLYDIKNAQAYNTGKIKNFSKVGVSVSSAGHLLVELEQGKSYFPFLLAHTSTYPIRKDKIQQFGKSWTHPSNIVTLGAYQLKKWKHDEYLLLKQNKAHWQSSYGDSKISTVLIFIIAEGATVLNLFQQGRLDIANHLPSSQLAILRQKEEHKEHPILAIYYYGMNTHKKPFNDIRVRKAFNYAIDRKRIVHLLQAGHIPLKSWIPKGMLGHDPSLGFHFNPKKARKLLAAAGYPPKPFPKVILSYNTNEDHKRVAESIQAQLKKHLNISIELSSQEWKTYLQFLQTKMQQLYRAGWQADYPDPHNFMNLMSSDSSNNWTNWKNAKYDRLIKQASVLSDKQKKIILYKNAQQILVEKDAPVIPIYSIQSHWLIHKRVAKFPLNVMNKMYFKKVVLH